MFGLGMPELVVILGIAFLVFGGKKLPELGAGLGKGIKSFQAALRDVEDTGKIIPKDNVLDPKEVNILTTEAQEGTTQNSTKV